MVLVGRNWESGTAYRFNFQGQEQDDELWGGAISFAYRVEDSRLGRFFSVDPLTAKYSYLSPYSFSENRLIDGIELEGKEWDSEHSWNDIITDADHIKMIGKNYVEGMTYAQAWQIGAKALGKQHFDNNEYFDCADFSIYLLVEFAYKFRLPIYIEDTYKKDSDPTFDNDNYGYTNENGKFVLFEKDDWEALAETIGEYYGSQDLYKDSEIAKDISWEDLQAGDLVGWDYEGEGNVFHSQTVNKVYEKKGEDKYRVIQGSLDGGEATPLTTQEYKIEEVKSRTDAKAKPRRWNFDKFDEYK